MAEDNNLIMADVERDLAKQNSGTRTTRQQKLGAAPFEIPVLPLQNTTLFPETMVPLAAGRPASMAAVEAALASEEKLLACISVRPEKTSEAGCQARRSLRSRHARHDQAHGASRRHAPHDRSGNRSHSRAGVDTERTVPARARADPSGAAKSINTEEVEAAKRNVQAMIQQALAYLPQVPPEVRLVVLGADDPVRLAYFLGSILSLGVEKEQQMLEANYGR